MHSGGKQATVRGDARLLHFVSTFATKTDTKWLLHLLPHLRRSGFDPSIACFYGGGPTQGQFEALGIRTFNLETPGECNPWAAIRAARLIRQIRPDVVHTHLLRADLFAGLAARWYGVPAIVSTAYALGGCRRARRRLSDGWLDRTSAALPTHTLAVSEAVRRDCVHRMGMNPASVSTIHTGVERPPTVAPEQVAALRASWGTGPNEQVVLSLSRLSHEKGIDTLLHAVALLEVRHAGARFVIAGDGPDRPLLIELARQLKIEDRVRFVGFLENVWPALAAADVFCLPSKSEGMPNALLEAMAMSRPIVATAVGGVPEAIECEQNGLLVNSENPAAMAEGISRLLADRSLAGQLGRAANTTIEQRFLAADVAARYARLYTTLIPEGKETHVGELVAH